MTNPTPQDREMEEGPGNWLAAAALAGYRQGIEDAARVVEQRGRELQARAVDVDRTCLAIRKLGAA